MYTIEVTALVDNSFLNSGPKYQDSLPSHLKEVPNTVESALKTTCIHTSSAHKDHLFQIPRGRGYAFHTIEPHIKTTCVL